jgi:hypothetical protein
MLSGTTDEKDITVEVGDFGTEATPGARGFGSNDCAAVVYDGFEK